MPRFVVLEHDHPDLHWDFMLEAGSVLKTWRLAKAPENNGEWIAALPLGDHRLFYLDYEGPVSGDRGRVSRWDLGDYEDLPPQEEETVRVRLAGQKLNGVGIIKEIEGQHFLRLAFATTVQA